MLQHLAEGTVACGSVPARPDPPGFGTWVHPFRKVAFSKLRYLSEPRFSHLQNGVDFACLGVLGSFQTMSVKHSRSP